MEQKTEASQAVSELLACPFCGGAARIESNRDWHRLYAEHDESCVFDDEDHALMYPAQPGYLLEIVQVWNRRAALKAQPAPTEAAQDESDGPEPSWRTSDISWILAHLKEHTIFDTVRLRREWDEMRRIALAAQSAQLSGNSGELHPSGNTGELAQGWDVDDLISDMDINEEVAGMRAELQASSTIIPSILAAQGEDSARLDDLATIRDLDRLGMELGAKLAQMVGHLDNGVEYLPRDAIMIAVTDWRSAWSKNAKARKPINRARASAETGGVKP